MIFKLVLLTILSYHAFFLNYWLILLIPAVFAQILYPIGELIIPRGISSREAKSEIEIHLVVTETKKRKCLI